MSIEGGVTTGAPKAAAAASGHGAHRAASGPAVAGGFAALLQGMGEEAPALESDAKTGRDALASSSEQAPAQDPNAVVPVPPPVAPDTTAPQAGTASTATGKDLPKIGAARARTDMPVPKENAEVERDAGQAAANSATTSPAETQPLLRQASLLQKLAAQQRGQAAETAQSAATAKRGEALATMGRQGVETQTQVGLQMSTLLAAGLGENGLRVHERRSESASGRSAGGELGVLGAATTAATDVRLDVPTVAPDAGLTTEMRVAEQVSYWVGKGAQSAELEVDGIDERPIQVSIALQGQEARVEFRAEQLQTRQILQDSVPHLRELLEREGLVLSGVSVGGSGADGSGGGQPSRERSGGRQAQVAVPELQAVRTGRASALSGGALDLFV